MTQIQTKQSVLKLIKEAEAQFSGTGKSLLDIEDYVAEYLTANGVIVLPCDVGSKVYFADNENHIAFIGNIVSYSLDSAHLWFNCHYKCGLNIWHPIEDFGKTVFLTREEAEKALAERNGE